MARRSETALETAASTPRETPSTMIGRCKLLEEIGEGGIVHLAEQKETAKRKVAVKVLRPGMRMREVVARLEAERRSCFIATFHSHDQKRSTHRQRLRVDD